MRVCESVGGSAMGCRSRRRRLLWGPSHYQYCGPKLPVLWSHICPNKLRYIRHITWTYRFGVYLGAYIQIHTCLYMHTHTYVYICMCICACSSRSICFSYVSVYVHKAAASFHGLSLAHPEDQTKGSLLLPMKD